MTLCKKRYRNLAALQRRRPAPQAPGVPLGNKRVPHSIVASMAACHVADPGSIPGGGVPLFNLEKTFFFFISEIPRKETTRSSFWHKEDETKVFKTQKKIYEEKMIQIKS